MHAEPNTKRPTRSRTAGAPHGDLSSVNITRTMYPSMNVCATIARMKVGTPLNGFLTVGTNHEDKTRPQRSGEIARNGLTGPTASEDGCLVTGDVVEDADGSAHADCLLVSTSGLTPRGVAAGVDFSLEALLAVDFSLAALLAGGATLAGGIGERMDGDDYDGR